MFSFLYPTGWDAYNAALLCQAVRVDNGGACGTADAAAHIVFSPAQIFVYIFVFQTVPVTIRCANLERPSGPRPTEEERCWEEELRHARLSRLMEHENIYRCERRLSFDGAIDRSAEPPWGQCGVENLKHKASFQRPCVAPKRPASYRQRGAFHTFSHCVLLRSYASTRPFTDFVAWTAGHPALWSVGPWLPQGSLRDMLDSSFPNGMEEPFVAAVVKVRFSG